jgi:hypothetical protein
MPITSIENVNFPSICKVRLLFWKWIWWFSIYMGYQNFMFFFMGYCDMHILKMKSTNIGPPRTMMIPLTIHFTSSWLFLLIDGKLMLHIAMQARQAPEAIVVIQYIIMIFTLTTDLSWAPVHSDRKCSEMCWEGAVIVWGC